MYVESRVHENKLRDSELCDLQTIQRTDGQSESYRVAQQAKQKERLAFEETCC